jgi:preprotein translocase subunit YajC
MEFLQEGDLVVTLGAGTITRVSDQIVALLKESNIEKEVRAAKSEGKLA